MRITDPELASRSTVQIVLRRQGLTVHQGIKQPLTRSQFKRGPPVSGQLQGVDDVPAESKPRYPRDSGYLDHLIAKKEAAPGFRRKGRGEALGTPLLYADVRPQYSFVIGKGLLVPAACLGQLTCQHEGSCHRKRRALPCK